MKSSIKKTCVTVLFALLISYPILLGAAQNQPCLNRLDPNDGFLVTNSKGTILYKQNESKKYIPASTLKLLTALAAMHHLGLSYRFRTEFYTDSENNLKIRGYGDPFLTSEQWQQIAFVLAKKIHGFNRLILDDSYFSRDIHIPGVGRSTNPYDAPPGALCANFNTVFFDKDPKGRILSAEPQTPITPLARERIKALGRDKGRYTFTHTRTDATRYTGELFLYFMNKQGVKNAGDISFGLLKSGDKLIHVHESSFTLEQVVQKMMEFSNNFIANQICIALGAQVYGLPGTLDKGVRVLNEYASEELGLKDVRVVEGSGVSRENRISVLDMKTVLDHFSPYRNLLKMESNTHFKTGTLKSIRTRVGYIENTPKPPCSFVVFLNREDSSMELLMRCIEGICEDQAD